MIDSATLPATDHRTRASGPSGGKYLTFHLADEEYGLEILSVQEIIAMMNITRVPRVSGATLGVINLRGKILPVVDLRLKFSMQATTPTERTCIIVVESEGQKTGIVVDAVREVVDVAEEQIEPTPGLSPDVCTEFVRGLGKLEDRVLLFLDIEKVLGEGSTDVSLVPGR